MVIPLNKDNRHGCLILADCKKKQYSYLDPLHPTKGNGMLLDDFLTFLRKRNSVSPEKVVSTGWAVTDWSGLPQQTDGNNCGIFVCAYAEAFIKNRLDQLTYLDCTSSRQRYAAILLRSAPCCKHLCLYCGKDEFKKIKGKNTIVEMVLCEVCKRWVHVTPCLRDLKVKVDVIRSDDYVFLCKICVVNGDILQGVVLD